MRTDRERIAPLGRGRMLPADPREALLAMAAERNETLTALSRLIGRSAGYLAGYVNRQSPAELPTPTGSCWAGTSGSTTAYWREAGAAPQQCCCARRGRATRQRWSGARSAA